ncbi:MAG: aminotransferase class I/II-fold pyridoxal phosphate-dependent enzyme [Candidatus Daviesbacteria bacterium]
MKELEAMKAVYCYYGPEASAIVDLVDKIPKHGFFKVTTPISEAEKLLRSLDLALPLKLPETPQGFLNLDMIHEPIIERIRKVYNPIIPGLKDFPYHYPTHGSSEGIFHFISYLRSIGTKKIYTLKGEYEGYGEYAKAIGIKTEEIDPNLTDINKLKRGIWFISNPSARDGNLILNDFIESLCNLNHQVALDFAYVGSTKPHIFHADYKNILAIFLSFSKTYGLFRSRIGFLFSKKPIPSLYANKWFNYAPALLIALKAAEAIGPKGLYPKYRPLQKKIITEINQKFSLEIKASDSWLLGHLTTRDAQNLSSSQLEIIVNYRRDSNYRFCLTPYFEKLEESKK